MSRRLKNTRIVTFDQDYKVGIGAKAKVIYPKGSTHAIHHKTVAKLEELKVKMSVEKFDVEGQIEKAKKAFEAAKKKENS